MKLVLKNVVLFILVMFASVTIVKAYNNPYLLTESDLLKVTNKNYTNFSTDKNFIIFVVDAVDAKKFERVLNKSEYKDNFKDFTYYPDTLSHYLFTRESIPLIISGTANYNKEDYATYYNKAFDNSIFLNKLVDEDYEINFYEYELNWTTKKARVAQNIVFLSNDENKVIYSIKCGLNNLGNNYIPLIFNIFPDIKNMNCNSLDSIKEEDIFSWDNISNYNYILNFPVTKTNKKQYKFIHTNGVHPPYTTSPDLKRIPESSGTENKEMQASLKLLSSYIDMLKNNGVYDNSVIVITADHGYNNGERMGKQNPILFIKGFNETNTTMNTSNKKVSHLDLADAYLKLLSGTMARQLFSDIKDDRVRLLNWYVFRKEDHMVEYKLDGHAWETNKLKKTGREYNR